MSTTERQSTTEHLSKQLKSIQESEHIQLGAKYKDVVTGFQGIATATTKFLWGHERVHLSAGFDKEKGQEITANFDAPQLQMVEQPTNDVQQQVNEMLQRRYQSVNQLQQEGALSGSSSSRS